MNKIYLCALALAYVALLLLPQATAGMQKMNIIVSAKKDDSATSKTVSVPQEDSLDRWLATLASYEGAGHGLHFRRLDNNDKFSYSCLQFQSATFKTMAARYRIVPENELQGEEPAALYDCDIQKRVARAMFLSDPVAAAHNWKNTIALRGLGSPVIPPTP